MKKLLPLLFSLPLLLFADVVWAPSEFLLNSPSQEGILPAVAIDPHGNAVAAWVHTITGGSGTPRIQVSYRPVGGNWSTPVFPSASLDPAGVVTPAVAIDKNGNAVVAWFAYTNGFFTVQAATKLAGSNAWNTIPQVSPTVTNAGDVVAAWDANGHAIVGWSVFGGVFQTRAINLNGSMAAITTVSAPSSVTSNAVMIANPDGDIIATWVNNIPGKTIQAATKNSNGNWTTPLNVSPTAELAQFPVVAYDSDRNAVIAWNISTGAATTKVYSAQKSARATSWTLHPVVSETAYNPPSQQVAMDANGNLTIAWIDNAPNPGFENPYVNVSRKAFRDAAWPAPTTISNQAHESEGCLSLGVNAVNEAVVLWAYDSTTSYNGAIVSRSLSADSTVWSPEITLTDSTGTNPSNCSVAVNQIGQIAGIWSIAETGISVQAAVGSFPVITPSNLRVSQLNNDFALLSEYYNILKWDASISPGVIGYNIYLYGNLVATVGPNVTQYEAHNLIKGQPAIYTVTAISADGQQSSGATISLE